MPSAGKTLRPRIEAQMGFNLLMELYDKGKAFGADSQIKAITKFLGVLQPGIEKKVRWSWILKRDQANQIVAEVRSALDLLRDGKAFFRPRWGRVITERLDGIAWDQNHGRIVRRGPSEPLDLFLSRVFDLLTEVAPWLRVCQRTDCKRFFLFQRPKQIYCSEQCAQRVRMARFLAQRNPASR